MANRNQLSFIRQHANLFQGPYLEIVSKHEREVSNVRPLFQRQSEFTRVGAEGDYLDLDLTESFRKVDERLGRRQFGTIFCLAALEECHQPFVLAENLTRLLRDDGKICLAGAFATAQRRVGPDYWRFTSAGIQRLFPFLVFRPDEAVAASARTGDFMPIETLPLIPFDPQYYRGRGLRFRGVVVKVLNALGKIGLLRWLVGYPYLLIPAEVIMIGRLPSGNAAKLKVLLEREDEVFAPDPKHLEEDVPSLLSAAVQNYLTGLPKH